MKLPETTSVRGALTWFYASNDLVADQTRLPSWALGIGPLSLRVRNFHWRREAITFHDIHHLLTGYPCTLKGEMQVAAWEFAAGPYPHPGAKLFCLPLITVGLLVAPRLTFRAFMRGRTGLTLYDTAPTDPVLDAPLAVVRGWFAPDTRQPAGGADIHAFLRTAFASIALVTAPLWFVAIAVYSVTWVAASL